MSNDPTNGSMSRTRKFGRRLFSSTKEDNTSSKKGRASTIKVVQETLVSSSAYDQKLEVPVSPAFAPTPEETISKNNRQPSLSRRQSKASSLFELFSKPKVERARGFHESTRLDTLPERSQTPAHFYPQPDRSRRESTVVTARSPNPQVDEGDNDRLNEEAIDKAPLTRSASRLSITPQKSTFVKEQAAKIQRQVDNWDPPPLFQAFPQAVKHGKLQGISASTEALLRSQRNKYNGGMDGFAHEQGPSSTDRRRLSVLPDTPDLMEKVFVLVTAGRLVQYSGTGNSDRMPEKLLQLGPKSAAFACDLIPGKHWVLQVVQSVNDLNMPSVKPSRSILSRLRVPTLNRRQATNIILIFDAPEQMDGWLKALRTVIERLGGKQRSETDPEHKRDRERELQSQKRLSLVPSHRFLVQRDPQRFNDNRRDSVSPVASTAPSHTPYDSKRLSIPLSATSSTGESPSVTPVDKDSSSSLRSRRISLTNTSATNSTALSPDLFRLEPLKETARFSSASTRTSHASEGDVITAATSVCSSSPPSPRKDSFIDLDSPRTPTIKTFNSTQNGGSGSRRRSMQNIPAVPVVPPIPINPVKRLSVVSVVPTIDRTNRNSRNLSSESPPPFPIISDTRQNQPRSKMDTPPIPEVESEASSIDIPVVASSSLQLNQQEDEKSRPISGLGQLPSLAGRSKEKLEAAGGNPPSHRSRPFMRPLPVRPSVITTVRTNPSTPQSPVDGPSSQKQEPRSDDSVNDSTRKDLRLSTASLDGKIKDMKPISPIKSLELLASELKQASGITEPPPSTVVNSNIGSRMSMQPLGTTTQPIRTPARNSFASPSGPIMVPGRRTSSVGSVVSSSSASERRNSSVRFDGTMPGSLFSSQTPSITIMNGASTQSTSQAQQVAKLRRPTSMQIRADHAPFLSSRNTRTSSLSIPNRPASLSQAPRISAIPLVSASQGAAPAPFVPYSRQPPSDKSESSSSSFRSSILQREHQRFSVRAASSPIPTHKHIATTAMNHKTPRSESPAFSNGPSLRNSYSATDLSGPSNMGNQPSRRLSFLRSSSRPQSPPVPPAPPIPTSVTTSPRNSVSRSSLRPSSPPPISLPPLPSSPPPIPPMNPNRAALLRAKQSMPNIAIAGLPPPMPPPSCPLPKVPVMSSEGIGIGL